MPKLQKVEAEEFVTIWQTADSIEEVIEKTQLQRVTVLMRSCKYRKRGIPLKRFYSGKGSAIDVGGLRKLAVSLEKPGFK